MNGLTGSELPEDAPSVVRRSRRRFILGGIAALGGAVIVGAYRDNASHKAGRRTITAVQAQKQAQAGRVTLIDIRRPDEWARTGIPQGSVAIDMRREDFEAALLAQVGGNKAAPIALICDRGGRSRGLAARLQKAGFSQIIDVPEGMSGSSAGPGWIKQGLPVTTP